MAQVTGAVPEVCAFATPPTGAIAIRLTATTIRETRDRFIRRTPDRQPVYICLAVCPSRSPKMERRGSLNGLRDHPAVYRCQRQVVRGRLPGLVYLSRRR